MERSTPILVKRLATAEIDLNVTKVSSHGTILRCQDFSPHGRFAPCMDISPHGRFATDVSPHGRGATRPEKNVAPDNISLSVLADQKWLPVCRLL